MADAPAGRPASAADMNGHEQRSRHNGHGTAPRAPERLRVEWGLESVVDDVGRVREDGAVALYCGEANPDVYCDKSFVEKVFEVVESKGARVTAITGPVIVVPDGVAGEDHGLIRLATDPTLKSFRGTFKLFHRRARFTSGHFRVVETDGIPRLYRELPHTPGAPVEARWCENMKRFTEEELRAQADDALSRFSAWKSMSVSHLRAEAEGLPLVTTTTSLPTVVEHIKAKGLDFNYLDAKQILDATADLDAGLIQPLASHQQES